MEKGWDEEKNTKSSLSRCCKLVNSPKGWDVLIVLGDRNPLKFRKVRLPEIIISTVCEEQGIITESQNVNLKDFRKLKLVFWCCVIFLQCFHLFLEVWHPKDAKQTSQKRLFLLLHFFQIALQQRQVVLHKLVRFTCKVVTQCLLNFLLCDFVLIFLQKALPKWTWARWSTIFWEKVIKSLLHFTAHKCRCVAVSK